MKNSGFYAILFHALYNKKDPVRPRHKYLYISADEFDACIEMMLERGFKFLDIEKPIPAVDHDRQILLTFDDGYLNNFLALEVLEKYSITATFFMVKDQIQRQQLFWWDVYFRNRIKSASFETVFIEIQAFKRLRLEEIKREFKNCFGEKCFDVDGDFDRPMNVSELKEFAAHPETRIGMHSASHEILTNLGPEELFQEIEDCKVFLEQTLCREINSISYPNGNFDQKTLSSAHHLGLKVGLTTNKGLNRLSYLLSQKAWLQLKRNVFPIPGNRCSVLNQLNAFADGVLLQ